MRNVLKEVTTLTRPEEVDRLLLILPRLIIKVVPDYRCLQESAEAFAYSSSTSSSVTGTLVSLPRGRHIIA